jgi:hypothetical protein
MRMFVFLVCALHRWIAYHMMQQAAVNGSLHQPGFAEEAATQPPGHRANDMLSDRERSDVESTVIRQLPATPVVPGNSPARDLSACGIRRNHGQYACELLRALRTVAPAQKSYRERGC